MAESTAKTIPIPNIAKHSDVAVAFSVIFIIIIMLIPLPTMLIDIFLAMSISISLLILLSSMYIKNPLEFSSFPSMLLIVTLFRLSLNVASTRLILLHGDEGTEAAGQVIRSFGNFVVGGNYVIGFVIFIILVIINFVVITKGTVRTSEVAARFTLDAMPGKQMSIDADLNAGIINETEARGRRRRLEEEADFYGHMDGAIRFVRGDAIAGIVIVIVNILGGVLIGIIEHNLPIVEAMQVYTLLTIGDGLVTQIPALIISTAAGIIVTRATSDSNLGRDIARELLFNHKIFIIVSAMLFLMALIPGLPHISFLVLSAIAFSIWYIISEEKKTVFAKEAADTETKKKEAAPPEQVEKLLPLDIMGLEVGYKLIPLVDTAKGGELIERIKSVRRQFALEMGIIVPPLHIKDNLQLDANKYRIMIKGITVASGEVLLGKFLAMNAGAAVGELSGTTTKEPAFGLPAVWIDEVEKDKAQISGYTVVDPATVIVTHVKEVIKRHAHELLGRQDLQKLLENLKKENPKIVEDIFPAILNLGTVQKVLQNLLREEISIRDLVTILETLAEYGQFTKDADTLTEFVRQSLARPISIQYQSADGVIPVAILDKEVEDAVSSSIQRTEHGSYLALDPNISQLILANLNNLVEKFIHINNQPIILTSPKIRVHFKRFIERFIPNVVVLSYNEILPNININRIGVLSIRKK